MLRGNPASSMQKTYDEVYLICSTAIYFEQQNNESEALRSWRDALDHIYYHNAYKIPAGYRPKTETEKALQDSLRDMELQCKERVDLFDTLRKSREEAKSRSSDSLTSQHSRSSGNYPTPNGSLGHGSVPPSSYSSLSRPPLSSSRSNQSIRTSDVQPRVSSEPLPPPVYSEMLSSSLKPPEPQGALKTTRSPSPEKRSVFRSTLRPEKKDRNGNTAPKFAQSMRPRPPRNASTAATLAWPGQNQAAQLTSQSNDSLPTLVEPVAVSSRKASVEAAYLRQNHDNQRIPSQSGAVPAPRPPTAEIPVRPKSHDPMSENPDVRQPQETTSEHTSRHAPPPPPPHRSRRPPQPETQRDPAPEPALPTLPPPPQPSYRKEYLPPAPINPRKIASASRNPPSNPEANSSTPRRTQRPAVPRKAVGSSSLQQPDSTDYSQSSSSEAERIRPRKPKTEESKPLVAELPGHDVDSKASNEAAWEARVKHLMDNLPKGVDKDAAKGILNEIVIKGDEVHWDDVAGLDVAKNALKEAVVYPFLRPDLFMGLREPARGMLLFGPPGTGKTMLARAVATESHSTFFAISASSLTSKFLGESEKLVRALFALAKALTPSIIFVDEIDSLLSSRGGGSEHEATRRIKTEFLIQWSDLAKAAAGKEQADGDASRVLVLAATNLPWAIDEAARRRFVRRQYIPLPEAHVRGDQLRRLMSAQKHGLRDDDFMKLVALTDGFSGSDITALAKDAAMGPLRSLGERLLHMSPEDIRPINTSDFEASLINIRPSVSKQGLKEFEDWAREFGERGG